MFIWTRDSVWKFDLRVRLGSSGACESEACEMRLEGPYWLVGVALWELRWHALITGGEGEARRSLPELPHLRPN